MFKLAIEECMKDPTRCNVWDVSNASTFDKSNATYISTERFPSIRFRYYNDILRGLYPLFGESEPDDAVRDNAAGAIARMIMVNPQSIPLNQVSLKKLFAAAFSNARSKS